MPGPRRFRRLRRQPLRALPATHPDRRWRESPCKLYVLVLASKSPRRQQILRDAGIPSVVRATNVPEERRPAEAPADYVRRLAEAKAFGVSLHPGEAILGADTTVVVDHHVLEKPRDTADVMRMLRLLEGCEHEVITGICLRTESRKIVDTAVTRVRFVPLSSGEL